MLQALIISSADKALAAYQSQRSMSAAVASFKGQTLAIECSDMPVAVVIEVADRLRLLAYQQQQVDCHVTGRVADLQKLQQAAQLPELIKSGAISLQGDVQLASRIADELRDTRFDSEEWLSQYLGDVPAHLLVRTATKLLGWADSRRQIMQQDMQEYLQDETKWLPASAELRLFGQQVASLDERCQQLAQRVEALTSC